MDTFKFFKKGEWEEKVSSQQKTIKLRSWVFDKIEENVTGASFKEFHSLQNC